MASVYQKPEPSSAAPIVQAPSIYFFFINANQSQDLPQRSHGPDGLVPLPLMGGCGSAPGGTRPPRRAPPPPEEGGDPRTGRDRRRVPPTRHTSPRRKQPPQLPSRRGPSRTPLPHSRPGPAPFAQTPPRALPRWSPLLYPGNVKQTPSVSFSRLNKNRKPKTKTNNRQEK